MSARILIIEDEPGLAELLAVNLEGAGYETVCASDGVEALRAFEQKPPDLVTLDLNVPKVSGFRLLELFKRDRPSIPIIAITAYSYEEVEEISKKGVDDFQAKPVDFEVLISKIQRLLERNG